MPQLEFSIWTTNLIFNWSLLTFVIIQLNSTAPALFQTELLNFPQLSTNTNNEWPWT